MADMQLRKFLIPEMIFGCGAHTLAGQYARRFDMSRVLLVSDAGVAAAGWTDRVREGLREAGIAAVPFLEVTSNPKDHEVDAGVACYREERCDGIVAVGGGSPIDCAKGIGIVCANGGTILDYEGVDKVPMPTPPLICIPSTAGSAADVSQFAIITDTTLLRKIAIISKSVVPDISLIDPELTTTLTRQLTACTGMDALVHAIEAYVSNASSPFSDLLALNAVRLVASHLITAVQEGSPESREGMLLACTQAGMAFSNASLGAVHAMAHSLGALFDSPHGECNALLLEHVIAFNYSAVPARYAEIGAALGAPAPRPGEGCAPLLERIHTLRRAIALDGKIGGTGIKGAQLSLLAEKAMHDPCMVTNPRRPTREEIERIYAAAL